MAIANYQELKVWQKSMDLATEIYKLVKLLPKEEVYSLSDQMRRAAVSIASNIAEGNGRQNAKEFVHFLRIAKGSAAELETQILLCQKIGYMTEAQIKAPLEILQEIGKMLVALQRSLL